VERSDFVILLDRSGSMQTRQADHEGGLRSFVRDLRDLAGDVRLTFVRFDTEDPCEVVFEAVPMPQVDLDLLTLRPRGGTPLLDAVGAVLTRFAKLSNVVTCLIITDGEENSSRKWTKKAVQELVQQREGEGWKLLYLGANVDEFAEAQQLGISAGASMGYSGAHGQTVTAAYTAFLSNTRAAYTARNAGADWTTSRTSMDWTNKQRLEATNLNVTNTTQSTSSDGSKGKGDAGVPSGAGS